MNSGMPCGKGLPVVYIPELVPHMIPESIFRWIQTLHQLLKIFTLLSRKHTTFICDID